MRRTNQDRWVLGAAWAGALAAAIFVLLWRLGDAGWATDEPVYRNAAVAIFEYGNWSHNLEHPPLGKLLIGASMQLFGEDAWAVRLPGAIATLLTGIMLALFTARLLRETAPMRRRLAALATFVTWTLLPHPDPSFDVGRLAYLDAPMLLFAACALYAAWRWQEQWAWRWILAAAAFAGLALATKFTALLLFMGVIALVLRRSDARWQRRVLQLIAFVAVTGLVALAPWLPLGSDLPRALRFATAMQARDAQQTIEVAGRTYTDGAPFWTQLWWQWNAWPAFALLQLGALVAAWATLPRRGALLVVASVLLPLMAFALGGRILPHWQSAWQLGMSLLVGALVGWLLTRAHARERVAGIAAVLVVGISIAPHVRDVSTAEEHPIQRAESILRRADVPGGLVLTRMQGTGLDRALVRAHPADWDGTYHAAAESQHRWIARDGGRPQEPAVDAVRPSTWPQGNVTGVVTAADAPDLQLPIDPDQLRSQFRRHEVAGLDVWIRRDLDH